jgi:GNAT superfamily N-acetyltransferase
VLLELDLACARAWPTLEEERVGSWRLRFARGVTKRANSVLPLAPSDGDLDGDGVAAWIERVELAYGARGLPPRFQVSDTCWPRGLPEALLERGYVEHDPTLMLTAPLAPALVEPAWEIELAPAPSEQWFEAWWAIDGRGGADEARVAREILGRIEPASAFASCLDPDGVAGIGLGVADGEWLGVYCMGTDARTRRRGCARAVLARLGAWALEQGARGAYLLVAEANEPARALYRSVGFEQRGRYAYFTRLPSR